MRAQARNLVQQAREVPQERSAGTIGEVIADLRGRLGRDQRFREVTAGIRPGTVGPLTVVFDGLGVSYRREATGIGKIARIVETDENGAIKKGAVGEGSRLTVTEVLTLTRGKATLALEATTTTFRTIDRIGAPTTSTVEKETGSVTIKENGRRTVRSCDPEVALKRAKEFY